MISRFYRAYEILADSQHYKGLQKVALHSKTSEGTDVYILMYVWP